MDAATASISVDLILLHNFAAARCSARRRCGSIFLDSVGSLPVLSFETDRHSGRPVAIRMQRQSRSWAHSMVEEAMVLANFAVGTHILSKSTAPPTYIRDAVGEKNITGRFAWMPDSFAAAPSALGASYDENSSKGEGTNLAFGGILRKHESSNETASKRLLHLLPAELVEELRGLQGGVSERISSQAAGSRALDSCSGREALVSEKESVDAKGMSFGSLLEMCSTRLPPHAFAVSSCLLLFNCCPS